MAPILKSLWEVTDLPLHLATFLFFDISSICSSLNILLLILFFKLILITQYITSIQKADIFSVHFLGYRSNAMHRRARNHKNYDSFVQNGFPKLANWANPNESQFAP